MKIFLYYDGKCPFCNRYAEILKLKKCFDINIYDARINLSWKDYNNDLLLDDGIILICNNNVYQGVEALNMLFSLCKYDGLFFSFQKFIFSNKYLGNLTYSLFKLFRKITLYFKN